MQLASPRRFAAADLRRIVGVYLCLILALQGFAAARAMGAGPLHHHTAPAAAVLDTSITALVFSHHGHPHQASERHHHAHDDPSLLQVPSADDAVDTAAFALTAALALMAASGAPRKLAEQRRHVWRPAPGWACCSVCARLLFEPPRPT